LARKTFRKEEISTKNYSSQYTANVYRDLQGLCGGFLQYLQGKPCYIYRLQGNLIVIIGFSWRFCRKTP
jgi:hypothetical protein